MAKIMITMPDSKQPEECIRELVLAQYMKPVFEGKDHKGNWQFSISKLGWPLPDVSLAPEYHNEYGGLVRELRGDIRQEAFAAMFTISPKRLAKVEEGTGFLTNMEIGQIASAYGLDAFALKHGVQKQYTSKTSMLEKAYGDLANALNELLRTQKEIMETAANLKQSPFYIAVSPKAENKPIYVIMHDGELVRENGGAKGQEIRFTEFEAAKEYVDMLNSQESLQKQGKNIDAMSFQEGLQKQGKNIDVMNFREGLQKTENVGFMKAGGSLQEQEKETQLPDVPESGTEKTSSHEDFIRKAVFKIADFCVREYGESGVIDDLENIPVAYTEITDYDLQIQATVNLEHLKIEHEFDHESYDTEEYATEQEMLDRLDRLDFDELTSVPQELIDRHVEEHRRRYHIGAEPQAVLMRGRAI